jgi:hypothetical protein
MGKAKKEKEKEKRRKKGGGGGRVEVGRIQGWGEILAAAKIGTKTREAKARQIKRWL